MDNWESLYEAGLWIIMMGIIACIAAAGCMLLGWNGSALKWSQLGFLSLAAGLAMSGLGFYKTRK